MRRFRSVWRLLLLASPISGAAQGRPLAVEDYYRLRTVGAPQMSPDGRWVAFTVARRIEATNGDSSEIWLVSSSGSASAMRVSAAGTHAVQPQWLDDGRLSWSSGGRRWAADPAPPSAVTELPMGAAVGAAGRPGRPMPSPDGRWLAVVRDMPVSRREPTFASDFERRHEERFRGVQFDWLDFQRDGQPFPVPNRVDPEVNPPQEIFLAAATASGDTAWRQVTRLGLRPAGVEWNRDGSALVFTADSAYRDERRYGGDDVYVVTRDGAVRRLTTGDDFDNNAAHFSPDGRWVLLTRGVSTDAVIAQHMDNGGPTDLILMPVAGGPERNLTADWDYLPAGARWSPDGRYVYFTGGVGGTTHLFRAAPAGGVVEQVTTGERRLGGISFDRAMTQMAYTVGRTEAPPEIWVARIDGSAERKLTSIHESFVRDIALSRSDRLRFASRDGTPVEGWLLLPYGFRAGVGGGPYPLVVANHGGPHAADGYAFDFKDQLFAANGYFVLRVNFRSSTGYGEKFLWGTWGAWGDRDGEDVMAGIDYVLAHYPVDRRRVAAMGHSYGGFMTNWLVSRYPDRFAAAIAGAGIVNWVSDYGTADIARTKETEFYGTPWEERARTIMIRQSPLTYADRVKAPTLFVHGEVDQRVPYSEAEQMYVALRKNGVPAKMIQYAGMPHSISGHWNVVHRMLNELHWLDQWLKPANP